MLADDHPSFSVFAQMHGWSPIAFWNLVEGRVYEDSQADIIRGYRADRIVTDPPLSEEEAIAEESRLKCLAIEVRKAFEAEAEKPHA